MPVLVITRVLSSGSRGNEVKNLQTLLARDKSVYPEGMANGVFGPKTRAAVQRFQKKYGIAKPGDTGYGVVGPKTRKMLQQIQ